MYCMQFIWYYYHNYITTATTASTYNTTSISFLSAFFSGFAGFASSWAGSSKIKPVEITGAVFSRCAANKAIIDSILHCQQTSLSRVAQMSRVETFRGLPSSNQYLLILKHSDYQSFLCKPAFFLYVTDKHLKWLATYNHILVLIQNLALRDISELVLGIHSVLLLSCALHCVTFSCTVLTLVSSLSKLQL